MELAVLQANGKEVPRRTAPTGGGPMALSKICRLEETPIANYLDYQPGLTRICAFRLINGFQAQKAFAAGVICRIMCLLVRGERHLPQDRQNC